MIPTTKEEFKRILLEKRQVQLDLQKLKEEYAKNPTNELKKQITLKTKEL